MNNSEIDVNLMRNQNEMYAYIYIYIYISMVNDIYVMYQYFVQRMWEKKLRLYSMFCFKNSYNAFSTIVLIFIDYSSKVWALIGRVNCYVTMRCPKNFTIT